MIHAVYTDKDHPDTGQVCWEAQCGFTVVDSSSVVTASEMLRLGEFTGAAGKRILCADCMDVLVSLPSSVGGGAKIVQV